jgi:hypothetical protein
MMSGLQALKAINNWAVSPAAKRLRENYNAQFKERRILVAPKAVRVQGREQRLG